MPADDRRNEKKARAKKIKGRKNPSGRKKGAGAIFLRGETNLRLKISEKKRGKGKKR